MRPLKEARKYAKTLINISGIENVPKALEELARVEKLMQTSREFKSMLVNPAFTQADREKAFKQVADRMGLSEKMSRFIMHVTGAGVIIALPEIIKAATAIYLEKKKQAKATVLTPVAISKDQEARLKVSLNKLTGKDVDIELVTDPALLGGILVKVGSTMYDSSIKGQLRLLKDELIKG